MNLDRILPIVSPLLRRALLAKQKLREAHFEAVPPAPNRVVFLGDSITEWAIWEDWFPDLNTTNRGIGGQSISDIAARLGSAIIEPKAISLLAGTNDLHGNGPTRDIIKIAMQMADLVRSIRLRAPDAPLLLTSVMPRSTLLRERIIELNRNFKLIAKDEGATYIDVWPLLSTDDGAIRPDCSRDGIHLTIAGYKIWTNALRPHLAPLA